MLTATDITVALHSCPKGSAPGCDGLTLEHILAAALEDPLLATELAAVCTLIANGALSAAATRLLGAGRLVALLKPDGKLRPIGIPTFLVRRLAARRAVLAQFRADIVSAHFAAHQLGIGVPFGVEAVPRAAQAWLDSLAPRPWRCSHRHLQ